MPQAPNGREESRFNGCAVVHTDEHHLDAQRNEELPLSGVFAIPSGSLISSKSNGNSSVKL